MRERERLAVRSIGPHGMVPEPPYPLIGQAAGRGRSENKGYEENVRLHYCGMGRWNRLSLVSAGEKKVCGYCQMQHELDCRTLLALPPGAGASAALCSSDATISYVKQLFHLLDVCSGPVYILHGGDKRMGGLNYDVDSRIWGSLQRT